MKNEKSTSHTVSSLASTILRDPNASSIQKQLAGSALSQAGSKNQTGSKMETIAAKALTSEKYSDTTKVLAASVLSQSNKKR